MLVASLVQLYNCLYVFRLCYLPGAHIYRELTGGSRELMWCARELLGENWRRAIVRGHASRELAMVGWCLVDRSGTSVGE